MVHALPSSYGLGRSDRGTYEALWGPVCQSGYEVLATGSGSPIPTLPSPRLSKPTTVHPLEPPMRLARTLAALVLLVSPTILRAQTSREERDADWLANC